MKIEHLMKKDNGLEVKLIVRLITDPYSSRFKWTLEGFYRIKPKRKFESVVHKGYYYRSLNPEERTKLHYKALLEYVTEEDIYNAKMVLWESIKPAK